MFSQKKKKIKIRRKKVKENATKPKKNEGPNPALTKSIPWSERQHWRKNCVYLGSL